MAILLSNYRHIIFMRHGEAVGSPDIARQLTGDGRRQSAVVATSLGLRGFIPDVVLCSGVDRTRQTLEQMGLDMVPTVYCGEDLYRASTHRDVLNIIAENISPDSVFPLVIGHNPTIHEAVRYLARESAADVVAKIDMSYAPSTASVFQFDADNWDLLHPSTTQLIDVITGAL